MPQATYPNHQRGKTLSRYWNMVSIWSCFRRGLPCQPRYRALRCALTAPFHLFYFCDKYKNSSFIFCGTFRHTSPTKKEPACPDVIRRRFSVKPGLSSPVFCLRHQTAAAIQLLQSIQPSMPELSAEFNGYASQYRFFIL